MIRLFRDNAEYSEAGSIVYRQIKDILRPIFESERDLNYRELELVVVKVANDLSANAWTQRYLAERRRERQALQDTIEVEVPDVAAQPELIVEETGE